MNTADASGLENVVAASTRLSDVDGVEGRLVFAGHAVEELAEHVSFEQAAFLLLRGRLPSGDEHARMQAALGRARLRAFQSIGALGDALTLPSAMDALRASVAHLSPPLESDALEMAAAVASAISVFTAAWTRKSPIAPDPGLSHAGDFLRMVTGAVPDDASVAALDAYLVTVIDHGMNASTFAARVVASTASDTISAVVAALGALKGKLHGGAPGPVLDMLDAIACEEGARPWLDNELKSGRRIMGMGHRVYRVRDPRADVLERATNTLFRARGPESPIARRLTLARAVEREAEELLARLHPHRPLRANVEFFTAVLLEAIGLPRALFTATFASSRAVGWCAHIDEQRASGRLIRPTSRYVGRAPANQAQTAEAKIPAGVPR